MRYANEVLGVWFMVSCTYIIIVNPDAHVPFIGISAGVFALYKAMQEWEAKKDADKIPRE